MIDKNTAFKIKITHDDISGFIKTLSIVNNDDWDSYVYSSTNQVSGLFGNCWYSQSLENHYLIHPEDKSFCENVHQLCQNTTYKKSIENFSISMNEKLDLSSALLLLNKASYKALKKPGLKKEISNWAKKYPDFLEMLDEMLKNESWVKKLDYGINDFLCKIWVDLANKQKIDSHQSFPPYLEVFAMYDGKEGVLYRAKALVMFAPEQVKEKLDKVYQDAHQQQAVDAINLCENYYQKYNLEFEEKNLSLLDENVEEVVRYTLNINAAAIQKNLNLKKSEIKPVMDFLQLALKNGTPSYYKKNSEYEKDYLVKGDIPAKLKIVFECYAYRGIEEEIDKLKQDIREMFDIFQNNFLDNTRKELIKNTELYTTPMEDLINFFLEFCKKQKLYDKVNTSVENQNPLELHPEIESPEINKYKI
jgi:hypothetical protein